MNRITLLSIFGIFLIFASFATSTPLKRQLEGFKQCEGDIPNTLSAFDFTPNPVVLGQNVTVHIAGKATEIVNPGTLVVYTGYDKSDPSKPAFQHQLDYCEIFVQPSGSVCPVKEGDFSFTGTWLLDQHPGEPQNLNIEYIFNVSIVGPDNKLLSCINGLLTVHYP